jgi:hypothetical protein
MSNFMLMSLGLPLPMAALFWRPPALFGPGWLDVVSGRTTASLVTAGFRGQHVDEDMLLRKAEVQYVLPKCRSTIVR